ncbi:MAG TPA: ROK family protein [Terriglobales bacterium]|nr:ROK family protein [Terriglobales bacterium]
MATVDALNITETQALSTDGGLYVGVDIGGTKVAAGIVNHKGEITRQTKAPMATHGSAAEGLKAVLDTVGIVLDGDSSVKKSIRGIGICSPGPLDPHAGVIVNPPNLPCWRNFPLAQEVSRIYGVPVKVDNDANAAALAECLWGAGRGYRNVFFTILGTGVGTGILIDGNIYYGRTGAAGEGGHVTIDHKGPRCGCGKYGCIEALIAGPAIAKRARGKIEAQPSAGKAILELSGGKPDLIASEIIGKAYGNGDGLAREILLDTVEFLTIWLGNVIDLLEPDVIIMGGGVSTMLRPFFGEVRDRLPRWSVNSRCQEIPIIPANYGNEAGIAGGAALTFQVTK